MFAPAPDDEPRTADALREAVRRGARPKYLFFWGHRPRRDGTVGAECLSQWYAAPFTLGGVRYPTAEHYMMAEKARLFADDDALRRILAAPHPGAAKQAGREVRRYDDAAWAAARFGAVVRGNEARFRQHEAPRRFLAGTGRRVLVEASPVDRVWGIGLAADDERAARPEAWRGENLLGFALMEVRARLLAGRPN